MAQDGVAKEGDVLTQGDSARLTIREEDEAGNLLATYIHSTALDNAPRNIEDAKADATGYARERVDIMWPENPKSLARRLLDVFLPAGYPGSVTDDYIGYQIYDSLQAFSSSIASLLSSRAVLEGVGVGNASATPTNALYLSIVQESVSRVATILFAHRFGTAIEPDCKMYRLLADVFNDAAIVLDCLSPAFPEHLRMGILATSSTLRALCGVTAGSAKGCLSAHFARAGNLGDLNAKDSSQETVISLLGMLFGSLVVSRVVSPAATWSALLVLLSVHLLMNYAAVRSVTMTSLNQQRANIVISALVDEQKVLTPSEVARRERIFRLPGSLVWSRTSALGICDAGLSMQSLLKKLSLSRRRTGNSFAEFTTSASRLMRIFHNEKYVVWFDPMDRNGTIVFKRGVQPRDQLKAWANALIMARHVYQKPGEQNTLLQLQTARDVTSQLFDRYTSQLEAAGWNLDIAAVETRPGSRIVLSAT